MINTTELVEIKKHLEDFLHRIDKTLEAQKPVAPIIGAPPRPNSTKRVEYAIWNMWSELKKRERFKAKDVKDLMLDAYCKKRTIASYTVVLSEWARMHYLEIDKKGSGPNPTFYKVPE